MSFLDVIARLINESGAFNTIDTRTIPVYFQRFPGVEASSGDRGIQNLEYRVLSNGTQIQSGQTPADGKIDCQVRGDSSTLQILFNGTVVSEYTVSINDAALDAATETRGVQQRLMMLGYDVGTSGADGQMGGNTEKGVLMFQADKGLELDGVAGRRTRDGLTGDAGE
ncbi:MAG TPA: peptidoglycan-binding domain-containing protein [Phycisphaerae bacterium]|nr:peptidoglycan-binding domain-containing protein [Phycisphaerae bacterium]